MVIGRCTVVAAAAVVWLLAAGFEAVHSAGEVGATDKNGSGCVCHGFTPSAAVDVRIEGPDSVAAGSTSAYTLVMTGGPAVAGGYNVAAARGSLSPGDSTSQLLDPGTGQSFELTQRGSKAFAADTVRWAFLYTAPAEAGADTLFSAANSVDLNGVPTGDAWNFGPRNIVTVKPDTAAGVAADAWPAEPLLLACYPNPFNPRTRLVYSVARAGDVRLEIFGIRGERVATLAQGRTGPGTHVADWDAAGQSSGVYVALLRTAGGVVARKLLLAR